MGMSFLWESHGKRPMGWDRHKVLWGGNGTDKHVPWITLLISFLDVLQGRKGLTALLTQTAKW